MKKHRAHLTSSELLRQKAEEKLNKQPPKVSSSASDYDIMKRNHELEVYQIELEMQNEELILATEQAKSNAEKYIDLYDYAPAGYFTLSEAGKILELNFYSAKLLGKERQRLKNSMFNFFVSVDSKTTFNNFLGNIFSNQSHESCEVTLHSGENRLPIHVYLTGHIIEFDKQCHITMVNITERMQAEEELRNRMVELTNAYRQLQQYMFDNEELKQFTYISSHQLQQPLRTIKNFVQMLEEDYQALFDNKAIKYLKTIKDSAARMNSLILALSQYSRLGVKKKLQTVDCNELLNNVMADLDSLIKTSGAYIEVTNMPVLNVYEAEIRQVFQNLIENAIKFQKRNNRPEILICSKNIENRWQFSISDNGIGIHQDQYGKIFDIFQRLHRNEEQYAGNGIGLAFCKKIIELHQGKIWVESNSKEGVTFYFTLANLTI
jgi:chemotaxis family two-component system sensor kinase Cph1